MIDFSKEKKKTSWPTNPFTPFPYRMGEIQISLCSFGVHFSNFQSHQNFIISMLN